MTTLPVGATLVYGSAGLQRIVRDSAYGIPYDTLTNGGRSGIGDVDLTATYLLFDSFGASQRRRLLSPTRGLRTSISAGWRFGTANGGRSDSPFDVPTGVGANALLLRTTTDLIWNQRFWVSGTVRYVKPMTDQVVTRFPGPSDSTLFTPFVETLAARSVGAKTELEIAPRLSVGTFFGLSMAYGVGRQQASTFRALTAQDASFGSTATLAATTVQSVRIGASFSSLASFVSGHSRWPIEALYSHGITVSGSGGVVPAENSDRIELRVYTRFPRR